MKKIALFLSVIYLLGCSGKELTPQEEQILGTWQLTEYCVSSGAGNCTTQPATAVRTQTLEFRKDGSFIQKIPEPGKFQTPIVSSGEFQIVTPGKIRFGFDDRATFTEEVQWSYELSGDRLKILPLCFEGCSYTYRRL
jgi:hypothetical protein